MNDIQVLLLLLTVLPQRHQAAINFAGSDEWGPDADWGSTTLEGPGERKYIKKTCLIWSLYEHSANKAYEFALLDSLLQSYGPFYISKVYPIFHEINL